MNRSARRVIAVLGFHKIGKPLNGKPSTWYYIPRETFKKQLEYLHQNDWKVIPLANFLKGIFKPETLPTRSVLLTFDDGDQSMATEALPVLRRFGYPAVFFVPTAYIGKGKGNYFPDGTKPDVEYCDWNDLRLLELNGISIQSHGLSHGHFSKMNFKEQWRELVYSKEQLEKSLKKKVNVIAYPYGDDGSDPQAMGQMLRKAGYQAAFLFGGGVISLPRINPFRLPRLKMGPDTNLKTYLDKF